MQMQPIAEQLDLAYGKKNYADSLQTMQSAIADSSMTPSATMLQQMQDNTETYYRMAMRKAQEHREFFLCQELEQTLCEHYRQLAATSHQQQTTQENNDRLSFERFLSDYWQSSQTHQ